MTGHRYKNGNDYWIQPSDSVNIRLRGRDDDSLLWYTSLRLQGNGETARATHYYDSGLIKR